MRSALGFRRGRRVLLLALALGLAVFARLGSAPLFDRDEGAFSEATREMVESGDYVSVTLNGEPRYDKPVLTYYAQAVATAALGWNEWGLRIHSALATLLWVLAVWRFGRRHEDEETGWVAAMLAATTLWVMVVGRAATADALLNLFLALCLFDYFRYWQTGHRTPLRRAFFWAALGFLTKGPIAVVIPAAVAILMAAFRRRVQPVLQPLLDPIGWLIFLAVAAPWYGAAWARSGSAFLDGFFLHHNVGRFAQTMEGHGGHVWYFVPVILLVLLPHTPLFLRTLPRIREALDRDLDLFLWCWFGFVFLFFSVSATQLPHYILHGATPLFLLMARHRTALQNHSLALVPVLLLAGLLFLLPELVSLAGPHMDDAYTRALFSTAPDAFGAGYRLWTALGLLAVIGLRLVPGWTPWQRLVGAGMVTAGLVGLALFPAWGRIQQGPTRAAALEARQNGWDVVMWHNDMPSFAVYYGATTPLRRPSPGEVVFTRVPELGQLDVPTRVLWQQGGVVLARALPGDSL